jgi:cell division protein ZapE
MHVSDIATAMIMKRLLESIFANKIYIVTSSNYHPDGLWPNGLMRERFLPAIEVLKEFLNVRSLEAEQDYRLFNDSVNKLFIMNDTDALNKLNKIFEKINNNKQSKAKGKIEVCNRNINYIRQGNDVIWFDFNVICGDMRSQLDYLELIKKFEWFIISDICLLTVDKKDVARRFTWLIDILYDSNRKLAISTAVPFKDIYSRGDFANEFERTISRLEEMQTQEYLEKDLTDKAG